MAVPKLVAISDVKVDKAVINAAVNNNVANTHNAEVQMKPASSDMFSPAFVPKSPSQAPLASTNILNQSSTLQLLSLLYSKMTDPFVAIQQRVDRNKQLFVDISDKLAAIYGEKEKDIKDKLSDMFKKLILRPYNLISQVDASMEQQAHHKEKKLKDREPESQKHELFTIKKGFSLKQWINYKLLEITGEILNLSRDFAQKIKEKNNILKKKMHNGYKTVKGKIVLSLNKIDSLLDSDK